MDLDLNIAGFYSVFLWIQVGLRFDNFVLNFVLRNFWFSFGASAITYLLSKVWFSRVSHFCGDCTGVHINFEP